MTTKSTLQQYGWVLLLIFLAWNPTILHAQKKTKQTDKSIIVPMKADKWDVASQKATFITYKNVEAMKMEPKSGQAILKDVDFANGTIEFDVEPADAVKYPFVSFYFRRQDAQESEIFYLRVGEENTLSKNYAVQYAPILGGVNLWDMLPHYQGPAQLNNKDWNHVKLVINGAQMRVYVNNIHMPALEIPQLEGNTTHGSIAFEGYGTFANLVVKPDATEDLPAVKAPDLTNHDANYIRKWMITSSPLPLPKGRELSDEDFPKADTKWDSISTERRGLVNVTRKFGRSESRRYVWLKATILADAEQKNKIALGFSDEVWIFLNKRMAFADKNLYQQLMPKKPDGRCSVDNATFEFTLQPGDNELLIGVSNDFYGWGIIARLESMKGVSFK